MFLGISKKYLIYNVFFSSKILLHCPTTTVSISSVHCVEHYTHCRICRSTGIILLFIRCFIISTRPTTNIRYVYKKVRNISIVSKIASSGRITSKILEYSYCRSTRKSRQSAVQALPPIQALPAQIASSSLFGRQPTYFLTEDNFCFDSSNAIALPQPLR